MPWILTQVIASSCILRNKNPQSLDQLTFCKDFARLFFWCVVLFCFFRSVQMRSHASEFNWMYLSAKLVQMGVQHCFTPEESLFSMELANTFRKKSVLSVNGERRQKTAAKSCEILSHTSHYPASKTSLKYSVLEERANHHFFFLFFFSVCNNKLFQGKTWILFDLSNLQIPHFSGVLNGFIFPPWNPLFNDDLVVLVFFLFHL